MTILKLILILAAAAILAGCNNPPSPTAVGQYGAAAHGIIQNGISDYKQVRPLTKGARP